MNQSSNTIVALLVCTAFLIVGFALGYSMRSLSDKPLPPPAPQLTTLEYRGVQQEAAPLKFTF